MPRSVTNCPRKTSGCSKSCPKVTVPMLAASNNRLSLFSRMCHRLNHAEASSGCWCVRLSLTCFRDCGLTPGKYCWLCPAWSVSRGVMRTVFPVENRKCRLVRRVVFRRAFSDWILGGICAVPRQPVPVLDLTRLFHEQDHSAEEHHQHKQADLFTPAEIVAWWLAFWRR